MMRVCIFTCRRDWEKAKNCVRTIPPEWKVSFIVEESDSNIEAPPGVDVVVSDFARGGNLSGTQAVVGVANALKKEQQKEGGRIAKVDSDCLLVETDFLLFGDVAGMVHQFNPLGVIGLAYSLSPRAMDRASELIPQLIRKGCRPQAEDAAITCVANAWADDRLPRGSFWDCPLDGSKMPPAGVLAVHCGSIRYAPRNSPLVAREMVRLGDALGLWRR